MKLPALASLFLSALVPLSACAETGGSPMVPAAAASNVGPGPNEPDSAMAMGLFRQVCLDTGVDLAKARKVVEAGPYRQNSGTGTYYHSSLDLSFRLRPEGGKPVCSMVIGTSESPSSIALLAAATGQSAPKGVEVSVGGSQSFGGRNYIRIFAIGQK